MRRHRKRQRPWLDEAHQRLQDQAQAHGLNLEWGDPGNPLPERYLHWIARQCGEDGALRSRWSGHPWSLDELLDLMQSGELKLPDYLTALILSYEAVR